MILNLAGNAIKFTAKCEVSLELRVLETVTSGIHVRSDVRDMGIGIPVDRLAVLFTPFSQFDASTTRQFGGTGLGLPIAKRSVELNGRRIGESGVESKEGVGSLFWFTARFAAAAKRRQTPYQPPESIAGRRVLEADDNRTNRDTHVISNCGSRVQRVRVAFGSSQSFGGLHPK